MTDTVEGWGTFSAGGGYYGVRFEREISAFDKLTDACDRYHEIFRRAPVVAVVSPASAEAIRQHLAHDDSRRLPVALYVRESLPDTHFYVGEGNTSCLQ